MVAVAHEAKDFLNRHGWAERETDDPVELLRELVEDLDRAKDEAIVELEADCDAFVAFITQLRSEARITDDEIRTLHLTLKGAAPLLPVIEP